MFLNDLHQQYIEIRDMRIKTLDWTEIDILLVEEKKAVDKLAARLETICNKIN
jgi:hypothetical protein